MLKLIGVLLFVVSVTFAAKYDDIITKMNKLQADHPNEIKIITIGTNNNGNDILAMRISSTPELVDTSKIGLVVVATHHGNEGETSQIALDYSLKALALAETGNYEIYLIPVLNISGFNKNSRYENGFDPNRDYPAPCKEDTPFKLKSTKALADLLDSRPFTASVTLHGFIGIVTYPWGMSTEDIYTADQSYYDILTAKVAGVAGYHYGNSTETIYGANGCYEDFVYSKYGLWSLLFEIADGSDSDVKKNVEAIDVFFKEINMSPSINHTFTGTCSESRGFRLE